MNIRSVTALFAALMAAGCGGEMSPLKSSPAFNGVGYPLSVQPLKSAETVYSSATQARAGNQGFAVAETGSNVVRIYPPNNRKNGPPLCTVPAHRAIDITSDTRGDLYVPNGDGTVIEYAPGCGKQIASWHEREGQPDDVAVFGKTVYVGILGYPPDRPGEIAVCTSKCNRELTDPSIAELDAVAVDTHGNVWASNEGELIVWRGGKMPGQVLSGFTIPAGGPAGLDVANDGTLIVLDEFNATVYSVSCNAQSASCNQLGHWRLRAWGFYGKLDKANAQYQLANQQTGQVDVYAYPGFTYQYSYDNGLGYYYNVVGITEFPE